MYMYTNYSYEINTSFAKQLPHAKQLNKSNATKLFDCWEGTGRKLDAPDTVVELIKCGATEEVNPT
jgi:hypothetical protein